MAAVEPAPRTRSAPPDALPVRLADIQSAAALLDGVTRVTPLERSRPLAERAGGPVLLKCENLQRTGSFKARGAYVRLARMSEADRRRGVVAASAGNHAQGVALAAQLLGIESTVFMPGGAPLPKVAATRGYGADVRFAGVDVEDALAAAAAFAAERGAVIVHPFDDVDIVAGQGTVGLEILEQCPEVRTILVPAGGGGLLAGVAVAVKALRPDVRVIGVQAAGAACFPESITAQAPVALDAVATMADGIAVASPGAVNLAIVAALVDEIVTVSEEGLSRALLMCLERAKLVVEPAGAAGVAAIIEQRVELDGPTVVVLSGGNVDPLVLFRVLGHGLSAAGRYIALRVRVGDRPGSLAHLLDSVAEADANVVEIDHVRTQPGLAVDEVEIELLLETRGSDHADEVVRYLDAHGHRVLARSDHPEQRLR
jgi:threonine dehydratase